MDINNVKKISEYARCNIITIWNNKSLVGACGMASWHLMCLLKKQKYTPVYRHVPGHSWIEIQDYVIDITATQFNIDTKHYKLISSNKKRFNEVTIVKKRTYYNYDNPWCIKQFRASVNALTIHDQKKAFDHMYGWSYIGNSEIKFLKLQQRMFV